MQTVLTTGENPIENLTNQFRQIRITSLRYLWG